MSPLTDVPGRTLGEIERFIEQARLAGLDGDSRVTVTVAWGGTIKKIEATG